MTGFVYAIGDSERVTAITDMIAHLRVQAAHPSKRRWHTAALKKGWRARKKMAKARQVSSETSGTTNERSQSGTVGQRRAESQPHPRDGRD